MGDREEIMNMSDGGEKTLAEDRIGDADVEKKKLVGSDEVRNNEEEVFEEAIGSREIPNPESFEADGLHEKLSDLDEVSSVDRGVEDLEVKYSVVGESHCEVNVQHITTKEVELDFVTSKMDDGQGGAVAEFSYGNIEPSSFVVENSETATSNCSNSVDVDKELVAEVISASAWSEETGNDGIENVIRVEKVDVSTGMGIEQEIEEGEGTHENRFEKGFVSVDNESGVQSETVADHDSVENASADKSLNDSIVVAPEGHSSSCFPGVTFKGQETVQNSNEGDNVQQGPRSNKEVDKQQQRRVNIVPEIEESQHVERESEVLSSVSSTEATSNTAALSYARPAGLGSAPLLLEPTPRVPQQPRVNGNVSHNQPQQAEDSTTAETDEHDETREKLQLIRVKFLRLAHRLGQTPHNVVVAQVLYRLGLAEQLRGRNGSRVGAFSFDRASAMTEQLEAAGQDPLDFSCTIMVLGKSGAGKSATINSIFDELKITTNAFQMGTKRVQDVEGFVQGIKVRVIDTPGLLPSWSDQHKNEKVLKSIRAFIKKNPPDIVLYLDRLDVQSRDSGDTPLLRTITDVFGPSIWFNAIVGLTHAASAPPDSTASSYEMFVTQRSHVIQQAIRQAAGDMRLMNPVSLIENHSACRTNRSGQRVLPNGQLWKPNLLLLSFASKILAEANALLKLQDNIPGGQFAALSKSTPLPFLLSSLLQSRPQVK